MDEPRITSDLPPFFDLADEVRSTPSPPPEFPPIYPGWPTGEESDTEAEQISDMEAPNVSNDEVDHQCTKVGKDAMGFSKPDMASQPSEDTPMNNNGYIGSVRDHEGDGDGGDDDESDNNKDEDDDEGNDDIGNEVVSIMAFRWHEQDSGYRYQIKWKGGDESWEPEKYLDGYPELREKFWSKKRKRTGKQGGQRKREKIEK
ncbi:MAG: hypothetical protein Q9216_000652 [Gyalolechia sp. 2 TL-2023]